jgi:hypothetical protein
MAVTEFRENPGIQRYPRNEQEWKHWVNEVAKWIANQTSVTAAQTAADDAQADATTGINNAATAQTAADDAQTDATTGINNAATAQTQADYSGYRGVGDAANWHTDETGTQPTNNDTHDLTATFYDEDGTSIATRTLRGTYTTAADTIAVTAQSTTGETTSYTLSGDASAVVSALVTHDDSEAIAVLTWSFLDETISGTLPAGGGGK